jgi:hypothetical protein
LLIGEERELPCDNKLCGGDGERLGGIAICGARLVLDYSLDGQLVINSHEPYQREKKRRILFELLSERGEILMPAIVETCMHEIIHTLVRE